MRRMKPKAAETPTLDRPKEPINRHVAAIQSIEGKPVQLHLIVGPTFFVELAIYLYTTLFVAVVWFMSAQNAFIMKVTMGYVAACLLGVSLHHTYLHFNATRTLYRLLSVYFFFMVLFTAAIVYLVLTA